MISTRPQILSSLVIVLLTISSLSTNAQAEEIGGFSSAELKTVVPFLKNHGMIALTETTSKGEPKAITMAVRIKAPRDVAFKVLEKPENFYYVSTLFKENKVLQEHDNSKAYSWASRHKWFSFVGTNTLALYPPRRVDATIVKSTLGAGYFKILFYEESKDSTIMVLSGLLDVKSSEWLIRYLVGVNPSMRMAMNIAIGTVITKGIKAMAEQSAAGKPLAKHRTSGKRKGSLKPLKKSEIDKLGSLLGRGTVVITDSVKKGKMSQVTVVDRVNAPSSKFLVAVASPKLYPKMINAISDIVIHSETEESTEFSWSLGFSIFNLKSRNRLTYATDGVIVEALTGDLKGALWRWQLADDGKGGSIVAYHGWADMKTAGYILDMSCKREPYLEHGFMAGSNMVMLRALKRVAEAK